MSGFVLLGSCFTVLACAPLLAQTTERLSVATGGGQADNWSYLSSTSTDARYVAFVSPADNLVPGDTGPFMDVFVRDRRLGTTERVSVDSSGVQGNWDSGELGFAISRDGRFVAFNSVATNLVAGDTNGVADVFVRDRRLGTTERISIGPNGDEANSTSYECAISGDGRFVAFRSHASNLVPGEIGPWDDIFVRDRLLGTTERADVDSSGAQAVGPASYPQISPDGRYVAFASLAANLVPGDTNNQYDVFLRDRERGTTERVSLGPGGLQANRGSGYWGALAISADARFVAFISDATNLVAVDTHGQQEVFLRDRMLGTTELVSCSGAGVPGDLPSGRSLALSDDGLFVAFESAARNLVPHDTNYDLDVFVRNRRLARTERVSVGPGGSEGLGGSGEVSICADGHRVVFVSGAPNLVPGDTNLVADVFLAERDESGYVSLCDPGQPGVLPCPCANPPSGPGSGCDNSAATGGASLAASGLAHLSADTLLFDANGERPKALSLLLQGTVLVPAGIGYGQGVRCVGGTRKVLFAKHASLGSTTMPDVRAGDPTVSARSAAMGDVILAGESRWYAVVYRDPVVIGGCPLTSTFNATQTIRVDWGL